MSGKLFRRNAAKRSGRALVDVEIILYHVCNTLLQETEIDGEWTYLLNVEEVVEDVKTRLLQIERETRAQETVLAFGSESNWRKRLDPAYKANRPRKPLGYKRAVELLKEEFSFHAYHSLEADDAIGINAAPGDTIVSSDKDLLSLPGRHYNPDRPELGIRVVSLEEADLNHLVLALAGDPTDGFKGAKGVGDVTARRDLLAVPYLQRAAVAREIFRKAKHNPDYALLQARLARVLRGREYDPATGTLNLWTWPKGSENAPSRGRSRGSRQSGKAGRSTRLVRRARSVGGSNTTG